MLERNHLRRQTENIVNGLETMSHRKIAPSAGDAGSKAAAKVTPAQREWLARGLTQAGGKLPLFDLNGREVPKSTIRACLAAGLAEPWFANPTKPDWLVCRLTEAGRLAAKARSR